MSRSGLQRRFRFGALALAGSLFFLAACSGDDDDGGSGDQGENASGDETTETSTAELPEGSSWVLHTLGTLDEIPIYANEGDTEPAQTIPNPNGNGVTIVFLVDTSQGPVDPENDEYLPVWLPVAPNQSKGWVKAEDVVPSVNEWSVRVEVGARQLAVFRAGQEVVRTAAGVGRAGRETPQGTYFIRESILVSDENGNPNPNGPYGPYAFGISGFSNDPEIIAEFGPDSSVGIHGTNDPSSIGQEVSSGCIRIANDIITDLANDETQANPEDLVLPMGTPIEVVA